MSNIQTRPKHRIFAGEFVPFSRKDAGNIKQLNRRMTAWLKRRGVSHGFNGRLK